MKSMVIGPHIKIQTLKKKKKRRTEKKIYKAEIILIHIHEILGHWPTHQNTNIKEKRRGELKRKYIKQKSLYPIPLE